MQNKVSNHPLVTVIVPSYNHEHYISDTLKSIVGQTYPNIQLIVIDDASTDKTAEIIIKFGNTNTIDMVLKKSNKGLIDSLNQALAIAKGKYIAIVASDDYWAPEKIERQVSVIDGSDDIKMVFTEGYEVDEYCNILDKIFYTNRPINKWTFSDVILKADLPPASFIARLEDIKKVGGYSTEFWIEDLPMWLMLLKEGGYAVVIRDCLVYYRNHAKNTHNTFNLKIIEQHYKIIEKFSENLPSRRSILNEWRLRNANMLARTDKLRSIKYLLPACYKIFDFRLHACIYKYIFSSRR